MRLTRTTKRARIGALSAIILHLLVGLATQVFPTSIRTAQHAITPNCTPSQVLAYSGHDLKTPPFTLSQDAPH